MKIVNGIMAQLPYTPPRTQLCIVELEDVCIGSETDKKILVNEDTAISVDPFKEGLVPEGGIDFGEQDVNY
ncbi:MAG: hypothetical protein HUJ83_10865 [Veillonella sp.]|nr:hypothetical protein [Veillonella sp.]